MEKSPEDQAVYDTKGGSTQQSGRKTARRRLIQSTLFPHRSPEVEDNAGEVEEDKDGDEGEAYCGSQGKCKRKSKRKANAQSRSSARKAPVMGKEALSQKIDNKNCMDTASSDFFLKASDRRPQNRQPREQHPVVSPERNGTYTALESVTEDRDISLGHSPQPVPDLWLEAKRMAEENARLFAGKQTHPFFLSCKVGKRSHISPGMTEEENEWCSAMRKEIGIKFGPIHVFEMFKDDILSLSWESWLFCERNIIDSGSVPESSCSSVFEGSVEPLNFDNYLSISNPIEAPSPQNVPSLVQSSSQGRCVHVMSPKISSLLVDVQVEDCQLLQCLEMDHQQDRVTLFSESAGCPRTIDVEVRDRERMVSYSADNGTQPENSLWTNKYQPQKACEVCGNRDSVNFLNDWLRRWHELDICTGEYPISERGCIFDDNDYSWNQSDSDTENIKRSSLKNVLLVTGPVGSGKSAAIYACAKEQGFQVIEVNASDWRNGALVKQKFGEAVESHVLKWSIEDPLGLQSKDRALRHKETAQEFESGIIELTSSTDEEESKDAVEASKNVLSKDIRTTFDQGGTKTLILFEDVDVIFDEDRGFITSIQKLAETAKRPIIVTSNSKDVLPDNLDRLAICFTVPSPEDLLSNLNLICSAENVNIQKDLMQQFIRCCHGDIRKTIMHLQFWCQGRRRRKARKAHGAYGPLHFDLDAGHQILPMILPWDLPSKLSELVEMEISKAFSMVKENANLMEVEEEDGPNLLQVSLEVGDKRTVDMNSKKEAMLRRNCSVHELDGFSAHFNVVCDSSSSDSPFAFTRRTSRRQPSMVLSADLEDEVCSCELPMISKNLSEDTSDEFLLDCSGKSLAKKVATSNCFSPLTCQRQHVEQKKSCENNYKYVTTESDQFIHETCKSVDISSVPESSFVPETEINNGAESLSGIVSCGRVTNVVEDVSLYSVQSVQMSQMEINNLGKAAPYFHHNSEIMSENTHDIDAELVYGDENVGNSQNEHVEAVKGGYQLMDECSRMDFKKEPDAVEDLPQFRVPPNSVQEAWRDLRRCNAELKPCVTSEQKDSSQIVKLAFGMSNIISEADLMLGCCRPFITDSLESSMMPGVEPDGFCCYQNQLEMTSIFAQHGLCFYTKESAAVGSNLGSENRVDLACEMLAATTNKMALGKLVTQDISISQSSRKNGPSSSTSLKSEAEKCLYEAILPIVPPRSCLAIKGAAFHEYVSSLGQISSSEASRLSESIGKVKKRRARFAPHYLTTGSLTLTPEDVSLLGQHSCYKKVASE